jgi:ATP-dependent exoDNAse (exonuclease V) alpha subunit
VLICANDKDETYVNGDRGTITELHNDGVTVQLDNGNSVFVSYFKWEKYQYTSTGNSFIKEVDGVFEQLPIRLGWAIVIHKAQGMTLDKVSLDVGRGCFSHGQLYVALSRVRDLTQLHLSRPLKQDDVIVRPEVKEFYKE